MAVLSKSRICARSWCTGTHWNFGFQLASHLVPHGAVDVVGLGGAAGGVHHHDTLGAHTLVVEGAGEELVVRAVHRVAALERDDVLVWG